MKSKAVCSFAVGIVVGLLCGCTSTPKPALAVGQENLVEKISSSYLADELIETSTDCKTWQKKRPAQTPETGFVRSGTTVIYVDVQDKFFGIVSSVSGPLFVDLSEDAFVSAVTPVGFKSIKVEDGTRAPHALRSVSELIYRAEHPGFGGCW